jgi:hypothetical protein
MPAGWSHSRKRDVRQPEFNPAHVQCAGFFFLRDHADMTSQRRLLQLCVAIGGIVPVAAGIAGVVLGPDMFGGHESILPVSHFRYLSGLLLAIGLGYWSTIPRIESAGARFRLLTFIVFVGGASRLFGVLGGDPLNGSTLFSLCMELGVTPALCWWQSRVARSSV